MTDDPEVDNEAQGRDGALAALLEVADDAQIRKGYAIAAASFEPADYEEIIRLAWRCQFDDDRTKFKRGIHALQEHVNGRIAARLELAE